MSRHGRLTDVKHRVRTIYVYKRQDCEQELNIA
jgi:hypothetical protein